MELEPDGGVSARLSSRVKSTEAGEKVSSPWLWIQDGSGNLLIASEAWCLVGPDVVTDDGSAVNRCKKVRWYACSCPGLHVTGILNLSTDFPIIIRIKGVEELFGVIH